MQAYHELPCNNIKDISSQIYNYIKEHTDLLINKPSVPWVFLDRDTVLSHTPLLLDFFKSNKLVPRDISVTVLYENLLLHYDAPPVVAKINFPVLNTENSVNNWYTVSNEDYKKIGWEIDPFGREHEDAQSLPKKCFKLIAEYHSMKNPVVFNSRIPHEVILLENSAKPRVVLSCTFYNEPLHYLQ